MVWPVVWPANHGCKVVDLFRIRRVCLSQAGVSARSSLLSFLWSAMAPKIAPTAFAQFASIFPFASWIPLVSVFRTSATKLSVVWMLARMLP